MTVALYTLVDGTVTTRIAPVCPVFHKKPEAFDVATKEAVPPGQTVLTFEESDRVGRGLTVMVCCALFVQLVAGSVIRRLYVVVVAGETEIRELVCPELQE